MFETKIDDLLEGSVGFDVLLLGCDGVGESLVDGETLLRQSDARFPEISPLQSSVVLPDCMETLEYPRY